MTDVQIVREHVQYNVAETKIDIPHQGSMQRRSQLDDKKKYTF